MKKAKIIVLLLLILLALGYFFIPEVKNSALILVNATKNMNVSQVVEYLRGYGAWAWWVSFGLMVMQAIIAPIPAFLITLSNSVIFGFLGGAFLSWISSLVGAALCFYTARILGKNVVEKLVGKSILNSSDDYFLRYGKWTILICRLLPFVSFDLISYAAGLTNMSFISFITVTAIGELPATLIYSYFGQNLSSGGKILFISLMCLFSLSIIIFIAKKIYESKKSKLKNENTTEQTS